MSTETVTKPAKRPFSTADRALLALHVLAVVVFVIYGWFTANDPGWATLQRIVILMMAGLWAGGIAFIGLISRMIDNKWGRWAILLGGPFIGLAVLILQQYLV